MNAYQRQIVLAWADKLRSGKYRRGTKYLRTKGGFLRRDKFCALGVLCDMAETEGIVRSETLLSNSKMYGYIAPIDHPLAASLCIPPDAVRRWVGLTTHQQDRVWTLSDRGGFKAVADYLEAEVALYNSGDRRRVEGLFS